MFGLNCLLLLLIKARDRCFVVTKQLTFEEPVILVSVIDKPERLNNLFFIAASTTNPRLCKYYVGYELTGIRIGVGHEKQKMISYQYLLKLLILLMICCSVKPRSKKYKSSLLTLITWSSFHPIKNKLRISTLC